MIHEKQTILGQAPSKSNCYRIITTNGHGYGDKNHGHTKNRWEEDYGEDYDNNDFNKINYNVWQ